MSCIYVEDTTLTSPVALGSFFLPFLWIGVTPIQNDRDHNTVLLLEEPLCWREIEVAWVALADYIRATAFLPRGSNDEITGTH